MSSFVFSYSTNQLVKAYTNLMMTCEPKLSILMAQVPVAKDIIDLDTIATAIRDWYTVGVKPLEGSIYPASVEENVEDRVYITDVDADDTDAALASAFHKAIRWNTPAK